MDKIEAAIISNKPDQSEINWNDFNWPPLIKIFHFNLSELQDPQKSFVRLLYISYLFILGTTCLNLMDNCIQAGLGYPKIRILYALLNILIFNALQMYIFYLGYRGMCAHQSLLKWYRILHLLAGLLWLTLSIIDTLGWNGFVRAATFIDQGQDGLVFLSIAESLGFLQSFILTPICICGSHKFVFDTIEIIEKCDILENDFIFIITILSSRYLLLTKYVSITHILQFGKLSSQQIEQLQLKLISSIINSK
ncbi:unnamed protein product [Paramecium octaurelia]|uniref:Uncharacterized protein n=1 Tax=Paramecium octaurelia TaxID=43137 RepID=A0A8S1X292_PAROT|nr:unnamed protein product [Paramecium octaurelia]